MALWHTLSHQPGRVGGSCLPGIVPQPGVAATPSAWLQCAQNLNLFGLSSASVDGTPRTRLLTLQLSELQSISDVLLYGPGRCL
jgi:hypothetical protein